MTPGEQYLLVEALRAVMAAVRDDEERYFADLAIDRLEAVSGAKQAAAASGAEEDAPETAATTEPTALDAVTTIVTDWTGTDATSPGVTEEMLREAGPK